MVDLKPNVQNYRRFIVSGAVECPIDNQGRILIRASGTEPVVRVMVEAKDASLAQSCAQRLADVIAGR